MNFTYIMHSMKFDIVFFFFWLLVIIFQWTKEKKAHTTNFNYLCKKMTISHSMFALISFIMCKVLQLQLISRDYLQNWLIKISINICQPYTTALNEWIIQFWEATFLHCIRGLYLINHYQLLFTVLLIYYEAVGKKWHVTNTAGTFHAYEAVRLNFNICPWRFIQNSIISNKWKVMHWKMETVSLRWSINNSKMS